jgi:hypothetical protein
MVKFIQFFSFNFHGLKTLSHPDFKVLLIKVSDTEVDSQQPVADWQSGHVFIFHVHDNAGFGSLGSGSKDKILCIHKEGRHENIVSALSLVL